MLMDGMTNWKRIQTFKTYLRHFLTCVIDLLQNNVKGRKISWQINCFESTPHPQVEQYALRLLFE